jgi:glucose-1-phosphate cytidylyltransferase
MKTVILCGGRGTRLGKHGESIPKALVGIGGRPILWHLLNLYKTQGINDFYLCLGHLGDEIRKYFSENDAAQEFNVTFVDTGLDTNTGGRIKKVENLVRDDDSFCVTYGDGLADIDLKSLIAFHRTHGRIGTLSAIHPRSPFGLIDIDDQASVLEFHEKPRSDEWINGGFFVFRPEMFDHLDENSVLEREPLENLSAAKELKAYKHNGFWKCMDTYKDNLEFNQLWDAGKAAWKVW